MGGGEGIRGVRVFIKLRIGRGGVRGEGIRG